jgi:hypothetical protein
MKIFECPQQSPEWFAVKRGVPSASDADKIVTPGGKLSSASAKYIHRLIADLYDPEYGGPSYQNAAMERGNRIEPEARRWLELELDQDIRQVGFCLTDDGRYGASPDGLIGDAGSLELKCPMPNTHVAYLMDGGLPDDYRPQVHAQLIVTGREYVQFVSYCPGLPPLLVKVRPDDYTKLLRSAITEFLDKYQEAKARIVAMRPL